MEAYAIASVKVNQSKSQERDKGKCNIQELSLRTLMKMKARSLMNIIEAYNKIYEELIQKSLNYLIYVSWGFGVLGFWGFGV